MLTHKYLARDIILVGMKYFTIDKFIYHDKSLVQPPRNLGGPFTEPK